MSQPDFPTKIISRVPCLGAISFETLRQFLSGNLSVEDLKQQSRLNDSLGTLTHPKIPYVGLIRRTESIPHSLNSFRFHPRLGGILVGFAMQSVHSKLFPAVTCEMDWNKTLHWAPSVAHIEEIQYSFYLTDECPHIEVMCRTQFRTLNSILNCLSIRRDTDWGIALRDEVAKRFLLPLMVYFLDISTYLEWEVSSRWQSWKDSNTSEKLGCDQIRNLIGLDETTDLQPYFPSEVLKSRKEPPFILKKPIFVDTVRETIIKSCSLEFAGNSIANKFKIGNPWYHLPFSKGGYYDEFLYAIKSTVAIGFPTFGKDVIPARLDRSLWWWNQKSLWPKKLRTEFDDNWSESAFFYEFRARILNPRTWDLFDRNWVQLDTSRRAILYYLVPPKKRGKHFREGTILQDCEGEKQIEWELSGNYQLAPSKRIQEERKKNPFRFYHLLALFDGMPRSSGRTPEKRWKLLEAMDLEHYTDYKMTGDERTEKSRAKARYKVMCKEANLNPELPFHLPKPN